MTTTEPTSPADDALTAASAVMPEPGDAASLSTPSDGADDLIARLAEQQIDDLLDGDVPADEAVQAVLDGALEAARELGDLTAPLRDETDKELAEAAATLAETTPAPVEVEPAPPAVAPSFNPPPRADLDASHQTPVEADHAAAAHEPAPHAEASDAEAVARELAADVAMLSSPMPAVVEHEAAVAHAPSLMQRVIAFILSIPMLILQAINLPVQPLSDRGREIIGGIGIVTLVNAAGLLIYLAAFAHRH